MALAFICCCGCVRKVKVCTRRIRYGTCYNMPALCGFGSHVASLSCHTCSLGCLWTASICHQKRDYPLFFLILAVAFIARCGASQKSQGGVAYTIQRGGKVWPIVFLTRLINRLLSRETTLHISGNPHVCVCLLYGSSLSTTSYEPI